MAHFLIDASLPRAVADVRRNRGHEATDARDIGLRSAPERTIAGHAKMERLCLISADGDFGHLANDPPDQFFGIVVVQAPRDANRSVVLALVERFLDAESVVGSLSGHLVIVEPGRIRVRRRRRPDPILLAGLPITTSCVDAVSDRLAKGFAPPVPPRVIRTLQLDGSCGPRRQKWSNSRAPYRTAWARCSAARRGAARAHDITPACRGKRRDPCSTHGGNSEPPERVPTSPRARRG